MAYFDTDQYYRDLESRRDFIQRITALTGLTMVTGASLSRGAPVAITGSKVNADTAWGGLKGRIVFNGSVPERKEVDLATVALPPSDLDWFRSMGPILNEDWVVDPKTKAVQWVMAWLIPESRRGTLEAHESLTVIPESKKLFPVDQEPQGYVPHAVAIQEGQGLLMRNQGPVAHVFNMRGFYNPAVNKSMPPKSEVTAPNLKAERNAIQVNCPPHPWERLWLRVFDHPYFAVTNAEGEFEFKYVPAGPCRLVIWQESIGYKGGRTGRYGSVVKVEGGADTDLGDISLSATTTR